MLVRAEVWIRIVEVPFRYLTFDDGAHAVKPALYEETPKNDSVFPKGQFAQFPQCS